MVGIWSSFASFYLIFTGVVMLLFFGLPLVFVPMRWARVLRWDVSSPGNLGIFFGRSLGVLLSIMAFYAIRVSQTPSAMQFYFELLIWTLIGMALLHIYGAIRKIQTITETLEIGLWVILFLVTLCFYPI